MNALAKRLAIEALLLFWRGVYAASVAIERWSETEESPKKDEKKKS